MSPTNRQPSGTPRTINVGLLWHTMNSGNLGVGALTVANLAIAREAARRAGVNARFTVLGVVDRGVEHYVTGDDVDFLLIEGRAMTPGGPYWRKLGQLDCVLDIGAGDSFADIYGGKRFAYLWATKVMAELRGVPLLLSPQTIGPFSRQPQTAMAALAMSRAECVIARDPLSFDVARRMAPRTRVLQSVDVAFALPFERRARDPSAVTVGVNVSGLLFNGGYRASNEFGMGVDYAAYSRRLIAALLERPGVRVELICHVNTDVVPRDDDRRVADLLAAEFPGVVRGPDFASPSAAKSWISGLDFLVAGRMHACIAAFSSGVPVVPVAYSRKFTGLFEGILDYRHLVPVSGLDTDGALAFTLDRLDRRAELEADIVRGSTVVDGLLDVYRNELVRQFTA